MHITDKSKSNPDLILNKCSLACEYVLNLCNSVFSRPVLISCDPKRAERAPCSIGVLKERESFEHSCNDNVQESRNFKNYGKY